MGERNGNEKDNLVEFLPPERRNSRSRVLRDTQMRGRIISLRKRGLTYQQVAEVIKTGRDGGPVEHATANSVSLVMRRYLQTVNREAAEDLEELRTLENERLDELLTIWGARAREGDPKAAHIVLRISERRAKMNGLDAATRVEHNVTGSVLHELGVDPDELEREREAFEAAFAPAPPAITLDDIDVKEIEQGDSGDDGD
jgi:DNA-binding transcriptional MerR regulator